MKKQALFLGCVIPLRFPGIEVAARRVFTALGVDCVDLDGYTCCPEPVVLGLADPALTTALSARNLGLAERAGADLVAMCNGCYETLAEVDGALRQDPGLRARTCELLAAAGSRYESGIAIRHFIEFLHEQVGIERIRAAVKRPVDVAVAVHYGCHLMREPGGGEPFRKPGMMRALVEAVGARVVDYGLERLCCGFPIAQFDKRASVEERLLPKLAAVAKTSAEALVFCCPACLTQFESGQASAGEKADGPYPCLHLLELLALALGVSPAELGFDSRGDLAKEFVECFWD
ncbi:MAG TPA: heterodisulfide reductase-related iron-sulfur binding cluster [Candidatus Sulfotelmatobacter sp.]|nr:heterodisulfide reductase-related iron-sulfur binding cluster [Candidatus Sulfotelmatobacter sp.]